MNKQSLSRTLLPALLGCSLCQAAHAERDPLDADLVVDAGWFFVSTDMRVRVDAEATDRPGTEIDFDRTFGIADVDRFRADARWRLSGRHSIRGMYFQNDRSASQRISREIDFGDDTFPIDATVTARSELTVAQISYEYAFRRRDNHELSASIGAHVVDIGLNLGATVTTPGGSASESIEESAGTTAPLPVLGIRWLWQLPRNFYVTAQAQYFYIDFDPYSGSLADLKATVVWQATEHFGVGVGYNDFGFRFDIDDREEFTGRLRWDYGGAVAFMTFMF